MNPASRQLVEVLQEAKQWLALPENDFVWPSWKDAEDALREIDGLISAIEKGELPPKLDLSVLFAPTGPIQEVSVSSGWGREFLSLSSRFDEALERVYVHD